MVSLPQLRLAWLVLAALLAAPRPATEQDPRRDAALERAGRKLARAEARRNEAYAALREAYAACEAWLRGEGPDELPPAPLAAWFSAQSLPPEAFSGRRRELRDAKPFHEIWNETLYRHSRAARDYASALTALERAFLARERLLHPERFQRGFEKTPPGMALIPGGRYTLGPATGDILEQPSLQRERTVKLRQFYLDRREVSCADYSRFLLAQPAGLREEHLPDGWSIAPDGTPLFPEGSGPFPVAAISWVSASRYADWAGKRLPTEDEWEAAAGGTERRRYPLGNRFSSVKVNCLAHGAREPRSPGEFAEDHTPLGLQSMTGNVREWTASGFEGRTLRDPGPDSYAVVRGGSYLDAPEACRSTYRWLFPARERFPHIGFRCAKDVR